MQTNVIKIRNESRNLRAAGCRPYGMMAFVGVAIGRPLIRDARPRAISKHDPNMRKNQQATNFQRRRAEVCDGEPGVFEPVGRVRPASQRKPQPAADPSSHRQKKLLHRFIPFATAFFY